MSSKEPKDELEKLIQESKVKGIEITNLGGSITQWGQEMVDLSDAISKVIQYPSPGFEWKTALNAWQYLNIQQDAVLSGLKSFTAPPVTTSGSAAAYSISNFANPGTFIHNVAIGKQDKARADAERLGQVLDKLADKESVLVLLQKFELNKGVPGKRSPIELFETAWAAFEKPVTSDSPVITSLVPMRECLNETIEALLRHRPKQESTKNEHAKIMSIGSQLAYDGTALTDIESWATRWSMRDGLLDELSGSKNKALSRDEWRSSLRRATLFLREILQGLNPKKFR